MTEETEEARRGGHQIKIRGMAYLMGTANTTLGYIYVRVGSTIFSAGDGNKAV